MNTFDPKQARLLGVGGVPGIMYALALDEPARVLFGAGADGSLYTLDLAAIRPSVAKKWELHENYVSGLALRGDTVISSGYDGRLIWSERATGNVIRRIDAHEGWVRKLVLHADRLATIGDDMRVNLWNAENGRRIASFAGHSTRVPEGYLSAMYALAISPDGKFASSGDRAGFVRVWDLERHILASEFRAIDFYTFDAVKRARAIGGVRGLAFSPDGNRLAVSGIGAVTNVDGFVGPCRMELWDWRAGKRTSFGQDKHQAILNHVAYGPSGSWLCGVGGGDGGGAIVFWDQTAAPIVAKPKGHLQAFTFDREGTRLYAVGHGGFQVWGLRA